MKKFLIILIVLLLISIGGFAFFLSKAEEKIAAFGYQPHQRKISLEKIVWEELSHPDRPIQSLTLSLWNYPPKITIDGMVITALPSSRSGMNISSGFSFPAAQIETKSLSILLDNFPPIYDMQGSLSPEISLHNQNFLIEKNDNIWNVSGTLPFEHSNISTTLVFSLREENISLALLQPRISHELLEKKYTLPDIHWKGTFQKDEIRLSSLWQDSEFDISIIPNFAEPKYSSIHFSSELAFSDLIEWFEIKKQLRPRDFSTQGSLVLSLKWEKNSLQDISFDAKELDVFGEIFPIQQLSQIGISYRPIHANTSRLLGPSSPDWIPYSQLGWLREAVIAAEDSQFRTHDGLNRQGIQDALTNSKLEQFSSGGSSITQQLAKNIFLHNDKSLERKLTELVFTISMEKHLSKEAILSLYLNAIEFGPNIYGAKQAASYYFMKSPKNLTIREAAFLAAILPNPLSGNKNAKNARIPNYKMNLIIENMLNGGDISKEQVQVAKSTELRLLMPK